MGCDIHFYVEKKINGQWVSQDKWEREEPEDEYLSVPYGQSYYSSRNYDLFAILADVRNGRGFAGIKTGAGFNAIAAPRGVPDDLSAEVKDVIQRWEADGHSHSYFTLKELLEYDWTQTTQLQGYTDLKTWSFWKNYSKRDEGPSNTCGYVAGGGSVNLTEREAFKLFEVNGKNFHNLDWATREKVLNENTHVYVQVSWTQSYHSCAQSFWSQTIPALLKMAGSLAGTEDVRIVFFFDN